MRRFDAWVAFWLVLVCWAGPALADEHEKVSIRVTVTHLSDRGEDVDPGAKPLLQDLRRNNIRYTSASVVTKRKFKLAAGDTGSVKIGGGRKAHLQLMQADGAHVLVAVDVEGGVKVDAKVRRGGRGFVVDVGKFEDGKRVLEIEAD